MPQATRLAAVCGQTTWVSGNNVVTGRESGGLDSSDELVEEVRVTLLQARIFRTDCALTQRPKSLEPICCRSCPLHTRQHRLR